MSELEKEIFVYQISVPMVPLTKDTAKILFGYEHSSKDAHELSRDHFAKISLHDILQDAITFLLIQKSDFLSRKKELDDVDRCYIAEIDSIIKLRKDIKKTIVLIEDISDE
jgi:hypothetical protein